MSFASVWNYDDNIFDILENINKALEAEGIHKEFVRDMLDHDGFEVVNLIDKMEAPIKCEHNFEAADDMAPWGGYRGYKCAKCSIRTFKSNRD
jgi:hypothetical protein